MTLQDRIQTSAFNSDGFLVEGWGTEPSTVVSRECRIYGEGSPWWGPARIESLEVRQCRVTLERLFLGRLWLRNAYLSTVRDVVVSDGGLKIGNPSDPPTTWPSAITLDGVSVQHGSLEIAAANICWHGGSVERTTGALEIGSGQDTGSIILTGVRFEHDVRRKLVLRGPSPVLLHGCHMTLTDVEITADAHPDTAVTACSQVLSEVVDLRFRKTSWWRF